jgi:hypothetical protein
MDNTWLFFIMKEKGPNSFQEKMKQALSSLIKTLTTNLIKEGLKDKDDTSVYTGISGILLTYHMMLKTTPEFVDASIKDVGGSVRTTCNAILLYDFL